MIQRTRPATPVLIALALVATPAPVPSQDREPPASPSVGMLTGETIVHSEDGQRIGGLEASVTYSAATQTGSTELQFTPVSGGTTLIAKAQVSAKSAQEGFGAVTALVASLAARPTSGVSSLRLSNVVADGDVAALRNHADRLAAWWDAQAGMAVEGYQSPILSLTNLARMHLNVWGTETTPTGGEMRGYAILLFDPTNPTTAVGGRVVRRSQYGHYQFLDLPLPFSNQVTLTPITETPTPNDFRLCAAGCQFFDLVRAELIIDIRADGTIDVRGVADQWLAGEGVFTVEGTGNAKFVPPRS